MLQIIGWILCLALVAYGLAIRGNADYYEENADGKKVISEWGQRAATLAIIGGIGFAILLYAQGAEMADAMLY